MRYSRRRTMLGLVNWPMRRFELLVRGRWCQYDDLEISTSLLVSKQPGHLRNELPFWYHHGLLCDAACAWFAKVAKWCPPRAWKGFVEDGSSFDTMLFEMTIKP